MTVKEKEIFFTVAFVKYAEIWANNEIGNNAKINIKALEHFIKSDRFLGMIVLDTSTEEDIYSSIDDLIFKGFPMWDFFIIPEWLRMQLEKDFQAEIVNEQKKLEKKYLCYTCEHFNEHITGFGVLHRCKVRDKWEKPRHGNRPEPLKLKRKCKYHEKLRKES